ncbi:hypothetical protein C0992_001876 [Termitomyces sp. T32_za158]|nr:hypothetical protein C0992_001876 [Termitomyces sp. T32_za158]
MDKAALALGFAWVVYLSRTRGGASLPFGPRPLPFVGNMFQIPQRNEWTVYEAWAKKYGPITYLTMMGTPIIVLNSLRAVRDLMDRRSRIYSNRPLMAMKELCDLDWVLTYISGKPQQIRRTTVQRCFPGPSSVQHRYHQQEESRVLLMNLLKKPDDLWNHIKQHASSSILLGTYGYRISSADDPIVHEVERSFKYAEQLNGPLAFLIEAVPDSQEDIDRITEGERLPTFDDWDRLPYINAIILEVLRYNTVTPLGLPHGVAKDDI